MYTDEYENYEISEKRKTLPKVGFNFGKVRCSEKECGPSSTFSMLFRYCNLQASTMHTNISLLLLIVQTFNQPQCMALNN